MITSDGTTTSWQPPSGGGGGVTNPLSSDLDAGGFNILFDNSTGLADVNGNLILEFTAASSAVNHFLHMNYTRHAG